MQLTISQRSFFKVRDLVLLVGCARSETGSGGASIFRRSRSFRKSNRHVNLSRTAP